MTPRNLRNIHSNRNSSRDALPCTNMALKLPQYFYLLMQKPLGHHLQVWSPYYQTAKCNQKTPIPGFIISAQIWFYIEDFQASKLLNSCFGLVVTPNVFHCIFNFCHYMLYHQSKTKTVFMKFVEFYWAKQLNIPKTYLEYLEFYIVAY